MPKQNRNSQKKLGDDEPLSLSLKLETTDPKSKNVDAEEFFKTAENWLRALKLFATEQGQDVRWQIVGLHKSSALVEVQPVRVTTGLPAPALVRSWQQGVSDIEKTGTLPSKFTPASLSALYDFVKEIPANSIVSIGNGKANERQKITPMMQYRIEQATAKFPKERVQEYEAQGTIRGLLAVLDSWKPEERSFQLKLPMEPSRRVKCTYINPDLSHELGEGFEGTVEISGKLKYRENHPWPFAAEVESIRRLPKKTKTSLKDLVGLVSLPEGQDSVSYIRSLRDAE
jgi:hypothetical protein